MAILGAASVTCPPWAADDEQLHGSHLHSRPRRFAVVVDHGEQRDGVWWVEPEVRDPSSSSRASRYSWLFSGIFVGAPDTTTLPPRIAARAGDSRGYEDIRADELETRYEAVLKAAEEACKGVRPWWDSNPRSPP